MAQNWEARQRAWQQSFQERASIANNNRVSAERAIRNNKQLTGSAPTTVEDIQEGRKTAQQLLDRENALKIERRELLIANKC